MFALYKQAIKEGCCSILRELLNIIYQYSELEFTGVGARLDCLDTMNVWIEAEVLDIIQSSQGVYIRYCGWSSTWNEWIDIHSTRFAPLYSFSPSDEVAGFATFLYPKKEPSEENKQRRISRFIKNPYNDYDFSFESVVHAYEQCGWYSRPNNIRDFLANLGRS